MGNDASSEAAGGREGGSIFDVCFAPSKDARQAGAPREVKREPKAWVDNAAFGASGEDAAEGASSSASSLRAAEQNAPGGDENGELTMDNAIVDQSAENAENDAGDADYALKDETKDREQPEGEENPTLSVETNATPSGDANDAPGSPVIIPANPDKETPEQEEERLHKNLRLLKSEPSKRFNFLEDEAKEVDGMTQQDLRIKNLRMDVCMAQIRSETAQCVGRNALKTSKLLWPSISNLNADGMPGERRERSASEEETKKINKMIHALDMQLVDGTISYDEYATVVANLRPQTSPMTPNNSLNLSRALSTSFENVQEEAEAEAEAEAGPETGATA